MGSDLIDRKDAIDAVKKHYRAHDNDLLELIAFDIERLPSAQPERLTDDDFETIRIHLSAYKEKLCNQNRWKEAEEYQRIIDRFMAFASAQPELSLEQVLEYCRSRCITVAEDEVLHKRLDSAYTEGYTQAEAKYRALWDEMPKIIRCRECKYAHLDRNGMCKHCDTWTDDDGYPLELYVDGDFYCGNAERKTDERIQRI